MVLLGSGGKKGNPNDDTKARRGHDASTEHFGRSPLDHRSTGAGAIRDVIENHLFQVLTLLAMDPFSGRYDEAVRDEKARFLRGVRTLSSRDVVRGQYRGDRDTDGSTPVDGRDLAAIRLHVDTWRWSNVPIIVRAGKCLPVKATEIIVELKRPPEKLFP